MTHKSYDKLTHEHFEDNFNIDFLRHVTKRNLVGNFIGSVVGIFLFLYFNLYETFFNANQNLILNFYFGGIIVVFICFMAISKIAGNNIIDSVSIAIRRGLYSFIFLNMFLLIAIIFSGQITLTDTYEKFLFFFLSGQVVVAVFAVTIDLLATIGKN